MNKSTAEKKPKSSLQKLDEYVHQSRNGRSLLDKIYSYFELADFAQLSAASKWFWKDCTNAKYFSVLNFSSLQNIRLSNILYRISLAGAYLREIHLPEFIQTSDYVK